MSFDVGVCVGAVDRVGAGRRWRPAVMAAVLAAAVVVGPAGPGGPVGSAVAQDPGGDRPPVLVVGHRGASSEAPEHTGAAYDRAVLAGADVLECDVQLTADEELVCVHDDTVDRTTGGEHTGRVDAFTLAELREMDVGSWFGPEFAGARVVTLEEQITCYRGIDPSLQFYLETKSPSAHGGRMEPLLVELLSRLDVVPEGDPDPRTSPVIIQSFDVESLAAVRAMAPSLPLAHLGGVTPAPLAGGGTLALDVIAPMAATIGPEADVDVVAVAHDAGIEAHTWTVDDPAVMAALVSQGIDGFFTNDPATARRVVDEAGLGSGREAIAAPEGTDRAPGCPEGMGIGFSAADAPADPSAGGGDGVAGDDGGAADTGAAGDEDGGSGSSDRPWLVPVAITAVLVAVLALAATARRRRRPPAP